ncbi:hypothetical protein FB567DRAFT_617171 [Paraphoma chrysanthemicola]|uniref:Uncharacterized protein n=1 Tax=Paraphoma chrysanthemicola TaxID=798071 RepID=A0A8K0RFJ0_9PLEO|nr:hypothetical protein FB567DRAFT_617171 [Paraphoma chrysanthemicola]
MKNLDDEAAPIQTPTEDQRHRAEVMRAPVPRNQLLPRLRVRAHLIDITRESPVRFYAALIADMRRLKRTNIWTHHLRQFFHSLSISLGLSSRLSMSTFIDFIALTPDPEYPNLFVTTYTLGFTNCPEPLPGDHVFVIDGLVFPVLLRRISHAEFRIVGMCYVWATEKLKSRVPGTRAGRSVGRQDAFGEEQTQIIEIY